MSDLNDIIHIQPQAVKRCKYPSCNAEILADSQFDYCEKCRCMAARNTVALVIDPCAPKDMERSYEATWNMLQNLSGDEILNGARRVEEIYLTFQKFIKTQNVVSTQKRAFKPLAEQIEEARNKNAEEADTTKRLRAKADKGLRQRSTRMDKLQAMFPNMSREEIKKMMDSDYEL